MGCDYAEWGACLAGQRAEYEDNRLGTSLGSAVGREEESLGVKGLWSHHLDQKGVCMQRAGSRILHPPPQPFRDEQGECDLAPRRHTVTNRTT